MSASEVAASEAAARQPGQGSALYGGLWGLAVTAVLGVLRALNAEPPELRAEALGTAVFTMVYATPYLLAIAASRVSDRGTRGSLLLPLSLVSLAATFSAFSGVSLLLLPATLIMFAASVLSLNRSGRWPRNLGISLLGLIGAAAIVLSFFALFILGDDDRRCWALTAVEGGGQRWVSFEPQGPPGTLRLTSGPDVSRSSCTSDVVTDGEAGVALLALLIAPAAFAGAIRLSSLYPYRS